MSSLDVHNILGALFVLENRSAHLSHDDAAALDIYVKQICTAWTGVTERRMSRQEFVALSTGIMRDMKTYVNDVQVADLFSGLSLQ